MFVQYFVIILICWFARARNNEERRCLHWGNCILSKSINSNNDFTITFCNNLVFYKAVVKNSVERCTCKNDGSQPKCLGENKKWYDVDQVMSTSGDKLDDCSMVQYCSGIDTPCCNMCKAGCTATYSSLFDFFGNHSLDFYLNLCVKHYLCNFDISETYTLSYTLSCLGRHSLKCMFKWTFFMYVYLKNYFFSFFFLDILVLY